jgi:hypothetical protein
MIVELTTSMVSPRGEFHQGDVVELPQDEAQRFIERGMALPVKQERETAAVITQPAKGKQNARISTARRTA